MSEQSHSIWRNPLLFILITTCGLASAILGEGAYDVVCWLLMSVPLAYIAFRTVTQLRARV